MRLPLSSTSRSEISDPDVAVLNSFYERGLYLQAYEHARKLPPLEQWKGTSALVIGGRIASNLEAPRLGNLLHTRAWREDRRSVDAACYRGYSILHAAGPLRAWRFVHGLPEFSSATPAERAALLSFKAEIAALFRDFDRADAWQREAEETAGPSAWFCTVRARLHRMSDEYEEALAVARHGLELQPWFRPAVQTVAELLMLLDRDEEAIELLREASLRIESASVVQQLAGLLVERERYPEALAQWERSRELAPIMEKDHVEWWHGRMSDTRYFLGDYASAADHARQAGKGFHERLAERLAAPLLGARRVHLKVPFVRQHDMTCAPATLSAICRYWKVEVDHLELARRICYDGTPGHVERHWAEENEFVVREFRVDWATAIALLDRGIPFTISSVETASAHAQALVGYDAVRGTLIIRDPYLKLHSEAHGERWLDGYAAFGPRGLLFLPKAQAHLLEGIVLPERELYDFVFRLDRALHVHDGAAAEQALAELEAAAPGHRLTLFARRQLAGYNASARRAHEAAGDLLKLFPDNNHLRWSRAWSLRELAPRSEFRAYLAGLAMGEKAEPLFWREYADDLRQDARERPRARLWLLRALHHQPGTADFLASLAFLRWDERQFEASADLLRLASCLRDKVEGFSQSWFLAARHLRRHEEVLAVLEARFVAHGAKSANPLKSLFWALCVLDRNAEAFARLETALTLRPDDGELQIFAADMHARHGHRQRADELLSAARGRSNRALWLRTAAAISEYNCDFRSALDRWRELLQEDPLAMEAQESVARLTAQMEGRRAAIAHLDAQCARFPHHLLLHRSRVEWLRADGAEAAEAALREVLALDSGDAWAHRELALLLAEQRRFDEALAACSQAALIAPDATSTPGVHAEVLRSAGRLAEARAASRVALQLAVDNGSAVETLVASSETFEEKKEALAFVRSELMAQTVYGDGLLAYHNFAFSVLPPEELLANLREALTARPDLWHAWSAVAMQLLNMSRVDDALDLAQQATARFPLLPRVWQDLGRIQLARKSPGPAADAFRQALAINPAWSDASRALASALQLQGHYDEARAALEAAIAASPLDATSHAALAEVLWRKDRAPAAIERLRHVLELAPDYPWAWDKFAEWTAQPGVESTAASLARELAEKRPGDPRGWLRLAELLPASHLDEALAALDRAMATDPRHVGAHDSRAWLLTRAGRFDEALAACRPEVFAEQVPIALQARAAWVTRERGRVKEGREMMRAVAAAAPDHAWAWEMIAAWSHTLKDHVAEREAARQLVRLNPRSPTSHAYLAQAEQSLGHHSAGLAALNRAWEIDPAFEFAAYAIFDAQIQSEADLTIADTLRRLENHLPGARTMACEIRFLRKKKEKAAALEVFSRLLFTPERDGIWIRRSALILKDSGWAKDAAASLQSSLARPEINSEAGYSYALLLDASRGKDVGPRIRAIPLAHPAGRLARIAHLEITGENKDYATLKQALENEREALAGDTEIWAAACYALVRCGQTAEAERWVEGWRERTGLLPWMLFNIAHVMRCRERDAEALAATELALSLPRDHTFNTHHAWLALEDALAGRFEGWKAHRDSIAHDQVEPTERAILVLAKSVVDVSRAPLPEREDLFVEARQKLRDGQYLPHYAGKPLNRYLQKAIELMASASRSEYSWNQWVRSTSERRARQASRSGSESTTPWEKIGPVIGILLYLIFKILIASSWK